MSSLAAALVTWEQFQLYPEQAENGGHYELHDGEVIEVPPPKPVHLRLQQRIQDLLRRIAAERGFVMTEFPYRPQLNLQFWKADVAYIPNAEWDVTMTGEDYVPYAPPLIVEVLSPSNRETKLNQQRIVAFSAGTKEFWVVDHNSRTVQVTTSSGVRLYGAGESVPATIFTNAAVSVDFVSVDSIFAGIGPASPHAV